jgi:hypothetical protein
VRYITVFLGIVLLLGSAIAQDQKQQNSSHPVLTNIKTVGCQRPLGFSDICVISINWLKSLEDDEKHGHSDGAIQLKYGDAVVWRHAKDFTLSKFVQVDCTTGQPNQGTDPSPFENEFSADSNGKKKATVVSAHATDGSCFKHTVTLSDGTIIDPHIIIGGTGSKHKPKHARGATAGPHTADKPK